MRLLLQEQKEEEERLSFLSSAPISASVWGIVMMLFGQT